MGLDIERPGLEDDQRPYFLDRHRLIAGDLHAFRHDPKGRALPHEEDDVELSLRLQRTDGDVGFPEPLLLQVGTDAADRILEQVFVDRTLALERHQFGLLVGWQRIAFEADGDDRAGQDVEPQIGGAAIVGDPRQLAGHRPQVAAALEAPRVIREPLVEALAFVHPARRQGQALQHRLARGLRLADDFDGTDAGLRAGLDVEDQDGSLRIVQLGRIGADRDAEVAVVLVELFERPHHLRDASRLRGAAEALGHGVAQAPLGQPEVAAKLHPIDGANRDEVVAELDGAIGRVDGFNLDVLEAPEGVEVSDGRAHGRHRQRLPDARLDEIDERGIGGRHAFDEHTHLGYLFARERFRRPLPGGGRRSTDDERHEQEQPDAHQKLRRTRKSTANVRSPVCVST